MASVFSAGEQRDEDRWCTKHAVDPFGHIFQRSAAVLMPTPPQLTQHHIVGERIVNAFLSVKALCGEARRPCRVVDAQRLVEIPRVPPAGQSVPIDALAHVHHLVGQPRATVVEQGGVGHRCRPSRYDVLGGATSRPLHRDIVGVLATRLGGHAAHHSPLVVDRQGVDHADVGTPLALHRLPRLLEHCHAMRHQLVVVVNVDHQGVRTWRNPSRMARVLPPCVSST